MVEWAGDGPRQGTTCAGVMISIQAPDHAPIRGQVGPSPWLGVSGRNLVSVGIQELGRRLGRDLVVIYAASESR